MLGLLAIWVVSQTSSLQTIAEKSEWKKTGRYEEVVSLCEQFSKRFPKQVKCLKWGVTPEGRPLLAWVASADGTFEPAQLKAKNRPVVFFQGGIHAGEIDGKDAIFGVLRELLDGKTAPDALKRLTVVFVPVFNVDGHERFGPNHRVNQVGPEETGWRVTAQNFNLNRDYAKAETPEMQQMLALLNRFDPILLADLHVTDGAKFEHDVAVMIEPSRALAEPLRAHGLSLQSALFEKLTQHGHLPLPFYPSFREDDQPESGFAYGVAPPRFSHGYWALRNRFGILVETHSWRPYAHRVKTTRNVVWELLQLAAREAHLWRQAAVEADAADSQASQELLALQFKPKEAPQTLAFRGYAYRRESSFVSGQNWIQYDDSQPQIWQIPYYAEIEPSVSVQPPSGYVIPPEHAEWVAQKLRLHGLFFRRLGKPTLGQKAEQWTASSTQFTATPFEGRQRLTAQGVWRERIVDLPAGTLWVPAQQPKRRLLVHLFEPQASDSFLQWGFFNAHFEAKEYMESYVAEEVARQQLADPHVRAEFEARLAKDEAFRKSPEARLEFFYRRHPSFDEKLNVYPVLRLSDVPPWVSER